MVERHKSLVTDDFEVKRVWKKISFTKDWYPFRYYEATVTIDDFQRSHFDENTIKFNWKSSRCITWFTQEVDRAKLSKNWKKIVIDWKIIAVANWKKALGTIKKWTELWRALLASDEAIITDLNQCYQIVWKTRWRLCHLPHWSSIKNANHFKYKDWKKIFPEEWRNAMIELPLVTAYANYDKTLIEDPNFHERVWRYSREAIDEFTHWKKLKEWEVYNINNDEFFLGWINIALWGVWALINSKLNFKWLSHLLALFLDPKRSWAFNEVPWVWDYVKFVELLNKSGQNVSIEEARIYLQLVNIYKEVAKVYPWFTQADLERTNDDYVDLNQPQKTLDEVIKPEIAEWILGSLWENNRSEKPCAINFHDWNVYEIPREENEKFQRNRFRHFKTEEKSRLKEFEENFPLFKLAQIAKIEMWKDRWRSNIAFLKSMPSNSLIEELRSQWISRLVVENMKAKPNLFDDDVKVNNIDFENAMTVNDSYNLSKAVEENDFKIYRIRNWENESFKHHWWWTKESFEKLEESERFIWVYWASNPKMKKYSNEFLSPLYKALWEDWNYVNVEWGWTGAMEWSRECASENWLLTVAIWASLQPEQWSTLKADISNILDWDARWERQSLLARVPDDFIVFLNWYSWTWTDWEATDEITGTSLKERPLSPVFVVWDPEDMTDDNFFVRQLKEKLDHIMRTGKHKWNLELDKLFVFVKTPEELKEKYLEFANNSNPFIIWNWWEKNWIKDIEMIQESFRKSKKSPIWFPESKGVQKVREFMKKEAT